MDYENEEFENIPLPDQIPEASIKTLDFIEDQHNSFHNTTRSRTVQTLMNQNQDLSSRLSVALKKNIELESRMELNEDHFRILKNKLSTSEDQNSIFKEKTRHLEQQMSQLILENQVQNQKFSELYNSYQEKIKYIQKLSYRLHRFLKYRTRIRGYVRPFINRLKLETLQFREFYSQSAEKISNQEQIILKLKMKVQEALDHIQKQTKTFEQDQADLVSYHETRYNTLQSENEKLSEATKNISQQNTDLKKEVEVLKENEVELSNKSIYFERIYSDLKTESEQYKNQTEEDLSQKSQRIKILESHTQQLSEKLNETIQYAQNLHNDHKTLNDQYSSLQILLQDNLTKIDDYKKRLQSLEQMNKELSQSLLEHRKKNDFLEERLQKTEDDFKRKLESFQQRFQKPTDLARAIPAVGQKELLSKIQNLLSEIQTGKTDLSPTESSAELISEHGEISQSVKSAEPFQS